MSKFPLIIMLFLLLCVMLGAEEVALRQATDVRWEGLHVRTTDNCEIVFWSDATLGGMDVFAQKINQSGQTLWTEPLPMVSKPGDQDILDVVSTSDNNFIIIWQEYEINEVLGVWAQKITSNGQRLWTEDGVEISDGGQVMREATLVANSVGGAFIAFQYGYGSNVVMGQNLDTLGNQLWQTGGIQLTTYNTNINLAQAVSDGAGGMIINYSSYENSQEMNHLLRLSETGSVIGNNPLMPLGSFPGYRYQIMPGNNGEYILYYVQNESNPLIRLSKINNEGTLLIPQTVDYLLSTYDYIANYALDISPDGGVAVAWKSNSDGETHWRAQRLSSAFAPMWPEPGVLIGANSYDGGNLSLAVGANDNTWIAWDISDYAGTVREVRAQMVNAAGVAAWSAEGMLLSEGNGNPLVLAYPDRGMFVWSPNLEGSTSVRRQVITTGGALFLAENGEPMTQGLNGQAYLADVVAFDEKFLNIWSDSRSGSQLYYQLSNSNMEPLLEENGRALGPQTEIQMALHTAVKTESNRVALLYWEYASEGMTYYLQEMDSNGEVLYPGNGIEFPIGEIYGTDIAMSYFNGGIYLAWFHITEGDCQIMGQRIVDGQKMWGENGRMIASLGPDVSFISIALQGRYFIWSTWDMNTDGISCKTLLVTGSGNPHEGWQLGGLRLIAEGNSAYEYGSHAGLVDGNLVAFISYIDGGFSEARAQQINTSGARMWGENGVEIGAPGQFSWVMDAHYGNDITCLLMTQGTETNQIRVQKISLAGELLLGESGNLIADNIHNCYDAKLRMFYNGLYFCVYSDNDGAWIQNRDVYIRYITPQGVPQGEAPAVLCDARYQQDNVQAAVMGNQAFIAWSDDRAGIINSEVAMTGVWGNHIISDYVAADDPLETTPAMLSIAGNYPNPFNPSTTISFELGVSGSTEVSIYNLKGQLVRTLLSPTDLLAGKHNLVWNGCDDSGRSVSSGIYLCNVTSSGNSAVRKMVLAK